MITSKLKILEWDSAFFQFPVGRIEEHLSTEAEREMIEKLIEKERVKLTYYSSLQPIPQKILVGSALEYKLVDRKTTYVKMIGQENYSCANVYPINNSTDTGKIIDLAIQSGIYSRFNIDTKIEKTKFEDLYRKWAVGSIKKELAHEVLVYEVEGVEAGFITLGEKNKRADIGIVAVDHSYRRMGIGKTLIQSAENWFRDAGYSMMQVVTQGENIPACTLYERSGFTTHKVEFFYHIWNNNH